MSRIAYVNGRFLPRAAAVVDVEDRGYQFADGAYEVIAVADGRLVDGEPHLDRLERSLSELRIPLPLGRAALKIVMRELVRRNRIGDGIVYLQVSRGVAPRNHAFPALGTRPALVMTAAPRRPPDDAAVAGGVSVVTLPDDRWGRPDIKSVSLLANVLAKQRARDAGAAEAWFVDRDGYVTEGSSTNAWIVTGNREVVTRPLGHEILAGITRDAVIRAACEGNFRVVERPFTVEEAKRAAEAFVTSTTSFVLPVTRIDGDAVGTGKPGPVSRALLDACRRRIGNAAGADPGGDAR